jgi:hypothetical protein
MCDCVWLKIESMIEYMVDVHWLKLRFQCDAHCTRLFSHALYICLALRS